jgi:archaellum component FlaC
MHAKSIKGEMKMQTKNKAYTTLIIAVLTLSMILAAIPLASAIDPPTLSPSSGNVGDKITVSGTSKTPGGLIQVYWDSVKSWDGKAGFLAEDYAIGTSYSIDIVIPNATKGSHHVIVKDVEANEISSGTFTVNPKITLSPTTVLKGDLVTVVGTGFAKSTSAVVLYKPAETAVPSEAVGTGDGLTKAFYLDHSPVKLGTISITLADEVIGTGDGSAKNFAGTLKNPPITPNTVTITATVGGNPVTITDDGNGGLSGTGVTGTINYDTGAWVLTFATAPDDHTNIIAEYETEGFTLDHVAGIIYFAAAPATGVSITAGYTYYTATPTVSTSTNDVGYFVATFNVPLTETPGTYDVLGLDSQGNTDSETLTVVAQKITLTPSKGYRGATVTVAGRGFTPGKTVDIRWYLTISDFITVVDDYPVGADGTFSTTFTVPTVPDPTPPGTPYTVKAYEDGVYKAEATFTVIAPAKITLNPTSGYVGVTVTIAGSWFTAGALVTFTFDGGALTTTPTPVYASGTGAFSVTFKVPNVAAGDHTVRATDAKGLTATATFKVTVPIIEIRTSSTEYMQGDTISIYAKSTESLTGVTLKITDPAGRTFWTKTIASGDVETILGINYLKWSSSIVSPALPSDAPLGNWNFTATDGSEKKIATNLFTVVERPTLATILDRLDEVNATLSGLITDAEGNLKAYINTTLGPVTASLNAINAKLVSIEKGVATINSTVGEIKVTLQALDLSAINAKLTSIENKVVTISTSIGTVQTTLGDINAKLVSLEGSLATIETDVGTIKTDVAAIKPVVTEIKDGVATVQTDVGVIKGKVETVEGNVATIKTDVGTIKADISDVKTDVATVPGAISGVTLPIWIAVVLSLIAAIASIYAVITIRRKIAG